MAEKKLFFTPAQEDAVCLDGRDLLISAAAGSGKTFVLIRRIERLIREGKATVDRVLAVTFTKAAAAELKSRLAKALTELASSEKGQSKTLRRQALRVPTAQISTIHSFCFDLLREYKNEAGLKGNLRIAEESEAAALLSESVEEALETALNETGLIPDFPLLYDLYAGARDDRELAEMIRRAVIVSDSYPGRIEYLKEKCGEIRREYDSLLSNGDLFDTPVGEVLLEKTVSSAFSAAAKTEEAVKLIHKSLSIQPLYGEVMEEGLSFLQHARRDFETGKRKRGFERLEDFCALSLPKANTSLGKAVIAEEKELRGNLKKEFERAQADLSACLGEIRFSHEEILQDFKDHLALSEPFFALAELADRLYTEKKRDKGVLDFADLEHFARRLLVEKQPDGGVLPTRFGREIASRYDAVFVDEYQDTNRVQDEIFLAITHERNDLFIVGDPKQSIYRFRGADPAIFAGRKNAWKKPDPAAPHAPAKILLSDNFRCDPGVIELVNSLFRTLMDSAAPDSLYGAEDELRPAKPEEERLSEPCEILLIKKSFAPETSDPNDEDAEASVIASEICEILEGGALKKDGSRYRPSDIAVLCQTRAGFPRLQKSLALRGIPCASSENAEILTEPETLFMTSLLTVLENPLDDVALIGALSSPVFRFTPDDLYEIRLAQPEGRFFSALEQYASGNGVAAEKARSFLKTLASLSEKSAALPLKELIWECYESLLVSETFLAAGRAGDTKEYLTSAAKAFESAQLRSIPAFLEFLREGCPSWKNPNGKDGVILETMHRSKGLEYPVVFCAYLGTSFQKTDQDADKPYLFSDRFGFVPTVSKMNGALRGKTVIYRAAFAEHQNEMLEEKKRLFYVALTRAKTKLYLTASLGNSSLASLAEKAYLSREGALPREVQNDLVKNSDSFLQFLFAALRENDLFRRAILTAAAHDDPKNGLYAGEVMPFEDAFLRVSFRAPRSAEPWKEETEEETEFAGFDPEEVKKALAFSYEDDGRMELPKKLSVSEIVAAGREEEEDLLPRTLLDFQNGRLRTSAAFIGTSMHRFMQFCDFEKAETNLEGEIARLYENGFLTREETDCLEKEKLAAFFRSPLYRRMRLSPRLFHEKRFNVLLDGKDLIGKAGEILVQGVVDAYFIKEDGSLCLVDFKTDRVREGVGEAVLRERHGEQLRLYAVALEAITGRKATELVLYSFSLGRAVEVER